MGNKEIIEGVYKPLEPGDAPDFLANFDENIEWVEAEGFPYGGTYIGANAILENVFAKLATEWENYTAAPEEFLESGDKIVVLGTYSGKYNATGKSMKVPFAHVWTLSDGKIVKFVQYTDTLKVSEVL